MSRSNSGAWLAVAALNAGMAVAVGAYAAHGLASSAGEQAASWARTGSQYQMWHALAVLALALASRLGLRGAGFAVARWCFLVGTVLFCGALYALAFGAPRTAAMAAPFGGGVFLIGWLATAWGGLRQMGRD